MLNAHRTPEVTSAGSLPERLSDDSTQWETARKYESQFDELCDLLKLSVNLKKNVTGKICTFLSIELDTVKMIVRLPTDKHQKIIDLVKETLTSDSLTHDALQSLLEFLSFVVKMMMRTWQPRLEPQTKQLKIAIFFSTSGKVWTRCQQQLER